MKILSALISVLIVLVIGLIVIHFIPIKETTSTKVIITTEIHNLPSNKGIFVNGKEFLLKNNSYTNISPDIIEFTDMVGVYWRLNYYSFQEFFIRQD